MRDPCKPIRSAAAALWAALKCGEPAVQGHKDFVNEAELLAAPCSQLPEHADTPGVLTGITAGMPVFPYSKLAVLTARHATTVNKVSATCSAAIYLVRHIMRVLG